MAPSENQADPSCREVVGRLDEHVAGQLSSEQATACAAHLARCPACTAFLHGYVVTSDLARLAAHGGEPVALDERLLDAVCTALHAAARGQL